MATNAQSSARVRFDHIEIDLRSGDVWKNGKRIRLQDQPFHVLRILVEHPGEIVTRDELKRALWPADTFVDFDDGLNTAVKKIRDVLGDSSDKPRYIETIPRRGYRFIHAVERPPSVLPLEKLGTPDVHAAHASAPEETIVRARTFQRVGSIALGVFALVLVLVGANVGGWRSRAHSNVTALRIKSLAVLPLENLTGDPSQDYFVDGMTDALTTELAQVQGLKVISRTSAMHYRGARKTLPEIARELNVDSVVEGSVSRSGDQVKITAQLIRASTDTHLWSGSYARVQSDILRLQAEVAGEIARQISGQLVPAENKAGSHPTDNVQAYDAYLKGVYFLNKQTPDGIRTAISCFHEAIEKDPNFAAAYARLSASYATLSSMSEISTGEAYVPAKEAAQKAVALDDNLDRAHTAMAWIATSDWDWTRAEIEFRRAIELNPNSSNAHITYSYLLQTLNRSDESAREERAANLLDPLSLDTLIVSAANSYYRRQYDEGQVKVRTAIELYPHIYIFHVLLSNFYSAQGNEKQSAQEILLAEETGGAPSDRLAALRAALESGGPMGLRRKRIELNKKTAAGQSMNEYDIAIDCVAVGDRDEAIAWLQKALRARDSKISLIGVEPVFDGIRTDPRFVALLRQMGLDKIQQRRIAN